MIERYTIKVSPAVSHKDLLKQLDTMTDPTDLKKYYQLKAKIEMFCEAEDLKTISDLLRELAKK